MEKRRLFTALGLALLSLLAVAVALSAATYAWFTFDTSTDVTPMEGKISQGDTNLLISESQNGPFDKTCGLNPADLAQTLRPVSTADLTRFYTASAQDREGYSIAFREVTDQIQNWLIHGTVYLQCLGGSCEVYFQQPALDLGEDGQFLAAGRLGLKITGGNGQSQTMLLKLDSLGSTAGAEIRQTVRTENAVVSGLNGSAPVFTEDPSASIGDYLLTGGRPLCTMEPDEIATVEYWLYLEGCDSACFNPVQSRDVTLQLGFAGNPREAG